MCVCDVIIIIEQNNIYIYFHISHHFISHSGSRDVYLNDQLSKNIKCLNEGDQSLLDFSHCFSDNGERTHDIHDFIKSKT